MSCDITTTTFEEVEKVRIECCDKNEIEALEKSIVSSIEQKLEKLNILIRNCNVYSYSGCLLVNDRYNVCSDLVSVSEAFGLSIKQIQCSLRGKNYLITDQLLHVLKQFGRDYTYGDNVKNKEPDEAVKKIILENKTSEIVSSEILRMVQNIKENGQYVATRTRTVSETYEDYSLVGREEGEWDFNVDEIKEKLLALSSKAQSIVNNANSQLRDGTAKLIYARARQMGYSVQEIKKGTQTQLVLVRCE